ncbi:MAG: Mrp/NBP35 family ATP-binding protein [Beijerinckiaceae bacterium]|nr:Mrp/NBP35 family ATP-binding protein [Beijerinckiaceae bacterium]
MECAELTASRPRRRGPAKGDRTLPSKSEVLRALELVKLPDGSQSLTASGRLTEIAIDSGKVMFSIGIHPAEVSRFEPVRLAAQSAVEAIPGVTQALVGLTGERRSEGAANSGLAGGPPQPPPQSPRPQPPRAATQGGPPKAIAGIRHVVAVASGKGGVGKSTTSCNLALGLARLGLKVGILDADIFGPSQPRLFGLKGKPETVPGDKLLLKPMERYGVKVMSIGFLVDEETPMIWRGPMVISAITQLLKDVSWGELDILVVDMPPGTGDAQLTMAQQTPLAGAVIVSTPQDLALIDARRGIAMFQKVEVPVLGVIENMSSFCCPNCGTITPIFGTGGARDEATRLGVPFLGEMPLDMAIRSTSDDGAPIVVSQPDSHHATLYASMAAAIWAGLESGGARRPPPRIVIE